MSTTSRVITPAFVDRWAEFQRAPGHRAILMARRSASSFARASAESLRAIQVPTLILHGENDALIEPASARKFAAAIPGAKLITYPQVGTCRRSRFRSARRRTWRFPAAATLSGPQGEPAPVSSDACSNDYSGQPVHLRPIGNARAIDDFIEGFLAYETRAEGIVRGRGCGRRLLHRQCLRRLPVDAARGAGCPRRERRSISRPPSARPRTRRDASNSTRRCCGPGSTDDLPRPAPLRRRSSDEFPRDLVAGQDRISISNSTAATRRPCCGSL